MATVSVEKWLGWGALSRFGSLVCPLSPDAHPLRIAAELTEGAKKRSDPQGPIRKRFDAGADRRRTIAWSSFVALTEAPVDERFAIVFGPRSWPTATQYR